VNRRNLAARGLGLAEMLVAIAITAGLLTAAAVAIDASIKAYSVNQTQADTLHRARVALHRLTTLIRTSNAHSPITESAVDDFVAGESVTDRGIELLTPDDVSVAFRFDSDNQQLIASEDGNDYVLLRNVTAFGLNMKPMRSATSIKTGGGFDLLARATITLTLRTSTDAAGVNGAESNRTVTLSTSVTPRRSL
jgi:Tfp pilus assembly protein PilW